VQDLGPVLETEREVVDLALRTVRLTSEVDSSRWSTWGAPTPLRCRGKTSGLTLPTAVPTRVISL
jgi:hypothetical protein